MYLEGIFSGSADIKTLLPVETSRFMSIRSEFLALMKKVSKSPMVLNIQGVKRSLKRTRTLPDSRSTGITAIFLNEESTVITGVATKEGEEVMFFTSVSTAEFIHMANAKFQYDFEQDKS